MSQDKTNQTIASLAKAELHNHIEGTAPPRLIRAFAQRHNLPLPDGLMRDADNFAWDDFPGFLRAYDLACSVIKTTTDYREIIESYLLGCAAEGAIYVEVAMAPTHAQAQGISYQAFLECLSAGIDAARQQTGIEARLIATGVRHQGAELVEQAAKMAAEHPHPYVTGFGLAGDEVHFPAKEFVRAFNIARDAGLGLTAHAGEAAGSDSVRDAIELLGVTRLGHGVRAVEDSGLLQDIVARGIVFEICPSSNLATKVYADIAQYPLPQLRAAGAKITLNSDDPPYFNCSLGSEYALAHTAFGYSEADLRACTITALNAAFIDDATRQTLLAKI